MRHRAAALVVPAGLAVTLLLTACESSSGSAHDGAQHSSSTNATSSVPAAPSAIAIGTGSQADITFAQSMIPHHQQAIEMADMALAQASTAQVRQLAQQIKDAQEPEIALMDSWLKAWGASEPPTGTDGDEHAGMDHGDTDHGDVDMSMSMDVESTAGMMSADDMDKLMAATGSDFDLMWLQMMIEHHRGAITMSEAVKQQSQNTDVTALADAIISAQREEIATMEGLLVQ